MERRRNIDGPLTFNEIIGHSIGLYLENFATFIGVMATVMVPASLIRLLFALVANNSDDLMANFLLGVFSYLVLVTATAAALAAMISATGLAVLHGRTSVLDTFDHSISSVFTVVKAMYLIGVIVVSLIITVVGIPIAIFLAVAWAVMAQAIVLEGLGARKALGRSWELTRGSRLRVFGITILTVFVAALLLAPFELPGVFLVLRAQIQDGAAPSQIAQIIADMASMAGAILILPLQYCVWTLLYFDLFARDEHKAITRHEAQFGLDPSPAPTMD